MFISETTLLRASSETWMNDLHTPTAIANHWEVTAAVGVTMPGAVAKASSSSPTLSSAAPVLRYYTVAAQGVTVW